MSSASQIAVAEEYDPSWNAPVLALAPAGPFEGPPPRDPSDPLWRAALSAVEASAPENALGAVWEDLARGRLRPWCQTITRDRVHLIARLNRSRPSLSPDDAAVLVRVLCGEPQKVVASELGIATSTASGRCLRSLDQLELAHLTVPLALVLAAQSWAGIARVPTARTAVFEQRGQLALIVSVPRPVTTHMATLTRAEQEVAQCLIEGDCRKEIARRRATSVHTVARQFSSLFTTLRIGGRYALIRCAAELRCFS
jgi:DNA-binding NarL/FixJ family response regulator